MAHADPQNHDDEELDFGRGAGQVPRRVTGVSDTHQDLHHAAGVDGQGEILATRSFATTSAGYRAMLTWLRSFGEVIRVGVEQARPLRRRPDPPPRCGRITTLEGTGPDPRSAQDNDDSFGAIAAAKAALRGQASVAKDRSGQVDALRAPRTTRKTAVQCRRCSNCATCSSPARARFATGCAPILMRFAADLRRPPPGPRRVPRSGDNDEDRPQIAGPAASQSRAAIISSVSSASPSSARCPCWHRAITKLSLVSVYPRLPDSEPRATEHKSKYKRRCDN
jgi:hypothetical protein